MHLKHFDTSSFFNSIPKFAFRWFLFGDSDHGSVGKFKPDWMALERRILHSITVSVKWLLSQPVSSYCSAKMEMRWKSGEISIWDNWNSRKKTERVIDVCFDAFNGRETLS